MSTSWVDIPRGSHFSLANIPFGIISSGRSSSRKVAVAVGGYALDLDVFARNGGFSSSFAIQEHIKVFSSSYLNDFASLGRPFHRITREFLQDVLSKDGSRPEVLKDNADLQKEALVPLSEVQNHIPLDIRSYTDFYAGLNHAYNVGVLFRGPDNALQPNYTHLPVGYHGRATSVVVSGTPINRPMGQILRNPAASKQPEFSPSLKLDIELELAALIATPNKMGHRIDVNEAENHIFGYVLMNDWSARDIQAWEYVPLGPFNSKNFGTTISAWVVLTDALEPFKTASMSNKNEVLGYLAEKSSKNVYDIKLEVDITTKAGNTSTITKTNGSNLLWSFNQMIAHHTVGGCPLQTGDLLGSGTISGKEPNSRGSLLEMTDNGKTPIDVGGGESRTFLEDGDTVNLRGWAGGDEHGLVGFGDCAGLILPPILT